MSDDARESCGRCSLSTAVDLASDGEPRDVLGEARIEVDENDLRRVSGHHLAASRLKRSLDEWAMRLTFGTRRD